MLHPCIQGPLKNPLKKLKLRNLTETHHVIPCILEQRLIGTDS